MFDTMTITKATGAFCGALLVFLLGSWGAEVIYGPHHAKHGEEHVQAYTIAIEGAESAEPAEAEVDFATLLAAADAGAGEKVFGKCASCHKIDGSDGTGPHLNGVVDRPKAAVAGFGYSDAILAVADQAWTAENLNGFLEDPKGYMPGTSMGFAGLPKAEDRANLIAFLAATQ
ncbi:MAG: c-type cytochrome [Rhodobacteraceae bacterium]|jgi:cytochrome c|nr:c-type cytochrome [Paracoccaceae bacterium]